MTLAEELEERGWTEGYDAFEEIVLDVLTGQYPSWSDEVLLMHPTQGSSKFCKSVRARAKFNASTDDGEYLILRVLVNNRKNRRVSRKKASVS